ncbi:RusA family crossover junction endodeoxyribonuclease [Listeria booriae]|uniref:RusA family crossover junction endodeoxyribonuclease n=1 Tax=Listeria booriae TaxID=1552123 RepID=A0A842FHC6_9LIST|nr:RusA family crossover junction endodeoxyribonuclease [Listeria booriae]MBC2242406.1 RusA family crossover junction endodeoxyribonuclease [Listeria booriae]
MFKAVYSGRPRPAERARVRFGKGKRSYYMYMPEVYRNYKGKLIEFFGQYESDPRLVELFDSQKIIYGLSVKLIFRLKSKGDNPFYTLRPDIDNLFKAVTDSLFQSSVNLIDNGYEEDKDGQLILDVEGDPIPKFKQKIDDCRICHTEIIKLRVDTVEEEGFTVIIRNIGKDDTE